MTPSVDRKSTRLNSSHTVISYAVFCLKKKKGTSGGGMVTVRLTAKGVLKGVKIDESLYKFFFFNDTATTEIYTLSLHDALPISTGAPAASSANATTFAICQK